MKLLLMADQKVGSEIFRWLLQEFPNDIAMLVVTSENEIWEEARNANSPCAVFESADQICATAGQLEIDLGVLAWWPTIIKNPLIDLPRMGFINTHPSMLPYNRGRHYNFWALVEQAPFGVSLHMVDEGVDSGDVVAQQQIPYGWEDNGESLYRLAQKSTIELFQETYPSIRELEFRRIPQDPSLGSFHRAAELDPASEIKLDDSYVARDLLNLLRARTFAGHPSCWFREGDEEFEVRIEIRKKGT